MSKELTSVNIREDAARPKRFDANMEPLKAGQYWKTAGEIPAKLETYVQTVYGFQGSPDREEQRSREIRNGLDAGVVLLVKELRYDDMGVHTVVMAAHPEWANQSDIRFLNGEFWEYFEREFEHEAVRLQERRQVEGRLANLHQELVQGPPPELIPALLAAPAQVQSPTVGTMVAHVQALSNLKDGSQQIIETANRHSEFIKSKTNAITAITDLLTRFYMEPSLASLAAVRDTIEYAEHLKKMVASMKLYTGEGVEVTQWAKGDSAPPDERLAIFQSKVYLAEEFLTDLNVAGLDYSRMDSFVRAISSDTSLRDRVFPFSRMIILARIRRQGVIYNGGTDLGSLLENTILNKPNLETFLLVRDGDNVYQVQSDLIVDKSAMMFPSKNDVDEIFRGVDGNDIAIDDLEYTDKLRAHDDYALFYKRLLILLWGLNDREKIFGLFYQPSAYRGFFDLGFQQAHFHFIYEDGVKLGTQRPSYKRWFKHMNSHLQSGSRVLVYMPVCWNEEQVPGAFSPGEHGSQHLTYTGPDTQMLIARRQGADHFVEVQSKHCHSTTTREPMVKIYLNRGRTSRHVNDLLAFPFLVMDAVKPDDLEFYRDSRTNRRYYAHYMELLFGVLGQARAQFAIEAPFKAAIVDAAKEGRLGVPQGASVEAHADTAVRMWRASHRGEAPPLKGTPDYGKALKVSLDTVYQLLGAGYDPLDDVPAFIEPRGLVPIRFVMTGKARYALYVVTPDAEREARIYDHVWVTRILLERRKTGLIEASRKLALLPRQTAEETTLKEWEDNVGDWPAARMPDGLTPASISKLIEKGDRTLSRLKYFDGDFDWGELYAEMRRYQRSAKRSDSFYPMLGVKLGVHRREDISEHVENFGSVIAEQNVLGVLYKYGNEVQRMQLEEDMQRVFKNPGRHVEWLHSLEDDAPSLYVGYRDDWDTFFTGSHLWPKGTGIPRNWRELMAYKYSDQKQQRVDGQWQRAPLRTFAEAVPYISKQALDWLNTNATQIDAKLDRY